MENGRPARPMLFERYSFKIGTIAGTGGTPVLHLLGPYFHLGFRPALGIQREGLSQTQNLLSDLASTTASVR